MNWALLWNSVELAALAALLATLAGSVVAAAALGLERLGRQLLVACAVVVLALPPFLVVNGWLDVAGINGVLQPTASQMRILMCAGLLGLMFWPLPFLLVLGTWQRLQSEHLEVEPRLTGWSLWFRLLWPAAVPEVGLSLGLTFVLALNQFSVPALLQVKVFPTEVWVQFNTSLDVLEALKSSWPMVLAPLLLLWLLRGRQLPWPRPRVTWRPALFRSRSGPWVWGGTLVCAVSLLLLAPGLPLLQLLLSPRTWSELGPAMAAGRGALLSSGFLAAAAATCVVVIAVLLAKVRWMGAAWILFLVPGVLLGILLIVVLNRPPWLALYQGVGVVVLAWGLRYFAPAWQVVRGALQSVDRNLTEAARLEGASAWMRFRLAIWPQTSRSLAAAWYIVFLLGLWDTETLVLIMPPGGETLALRIFNFLHYGHQAQVNALCLVLLAVALLPCFVLFVGTRLRAAWVRWQLGPTVVGILGLGLAGAGCTRSGQDRAPLDSRFFAEVTVVGSRGVGLGQFHKPRSVAVDAQDNLYVADMTGRVQRFSPEGVFLAYWQMPQTDLGKAKGMCRDEQGNIVVLEPHYARVNHYAPDGRLVEQWGRRGTNVGEFTFPRAVAVAPDGRTYVSEYLHQERVQVFRPGRRECESVFGTAGRGNGQFNRPEGLTLDGAGRVYVADSCNHRVQVFSSEGRFERAYGSAGAGVGELSYPYDLAVDAEGRQYICEFGNSRIQVFDAAGRSLEILGGLGVAPGQFSNPWSVALDSRGNLYVADSMNHRVQKLHRRPADGRR